MSNISRRDFLKTAGVMTLAVAATGVLAGCEGKTNAGEENAQQTAVNTAVVGAYTIDLKNSTLVKVKKLTGDTVSYENRLYVMFNVKKDSKDPLAEIKFSLSEEKENLPVYNGVMSEKAMKKIFGTTDVKAYNAGSFENDIALISNEGVNFFTTFTVAKDETPAYTLVVTPKDKAKDPIKLVASIPAAVQIDAKDLDL